MKKSNIFHIIYFLIFIVILIGFTFPIAFNMSKMVYGPVHNTDNRAAVWHFWWFNYSSQNNLDPSTNTLVSYPFGTKNMGPKLFPLCVIPAYILSVTFNEFFAYNALLIASFILSFLCMYILVFYLTKKSYSSICFRGNLQLLPLSFQ